MNVLGIGTEIVECLRIAQMIERHGEDFLRRIYTAREIEYCSSRKSATQLYASRWAGKHAIIKALGVTLTGGVDWRDIEIRRQKDGRVTAAFTGEIREACVSQGVEQIAVSIAHCRSHATGHAIAFTSSRE